ncbi:MAG: thiamine pyrophosphate-dependent dehydrogenase E1 component subunit alpha [Clostridium sp.]|uniref:thiamine pyrophosphate-dependent dehydrogenase E1 component subunit alpha n=1 Tax=Clostridium sp. TaxID=1506 RepID=UPI003DA91B64|nr:thiamine pyrophosphate-dependent dehydrogenase E1 component subunit alpha [Clostridium sp.]MCI1714769.1 thiamine pyrophosphate-dependent dehydrogenase E1 component subunit alpha [Clostridium sp.]MCI1799042.1 thiamine pyrophosphate-dependent dehydrogenase E1 component subunit alpha [Clostridium sp.]MCI1812952.1 thiamine pyrophosphate-dependent dehydrogenase E1 component subunit alpha [Clostridium sp.]MCI1869842.1 thiamine pyrophosphate-dependent dehydrogenase E1 component subunit alpha [Clost
MLKIRAFENMAKDSFAEGKIPGFVHLYIGEEAVASGVCENLTDSDYITSTHRGHGHIIAKGGELKYMTAELFGRSTGYCKGKGGSMHIADATKGILGANGIVGAGHDIALGAGMSAQYRGTDQVCVCFFGDASTNQGTFHESLNLASVWKLPIVYVCENNGYGISVSQKRHQNIKNVADRAKAYGIPGVVVDGNDPIAVYKASREAVERARAGKGPTLIECKTYRQRGHFEGDPAPYKPKEEQEAWIKKDPIPIFEKYLLDNKIIDENGLKDIKETVDNEIKEAVDFAMKSPEPELDSVFEDVYTDIKEGVD